MALALAGVVTMSLVATACSDDDDEPEDGDTTPVATSAATSAATSGPTTPEGTETTGGEIDISGVAELEDGVLNVGSDIAYAPIEFFDESNTPVGLDIDLAEAMGAKLGVEVEFNNEAFASLLPSLAAERYDVIWSAMTASEERKLEVNFVEYFTAGSGIIVPAGNPDGITTIEDLCGKTVAVQDGTVQVEYLEGDGQGGGGQSQACVDAGGEEITVLKFPSDPEAVQAVLAGQADVEMADYPVAAYSVSQNEGEIEIITGYQFDAGNYGVAIRKDSTPLQEALQAALDAIIEDGTYASILAEWSQEAGALR